jgi:hypothetical protein
MAYGMMAPGGRAKNFAKSMLEDLDLDSNYGFLNIAQRTEIT